MANVCGVDRVLRIVLGLVVVVLTFFGPMATTLFPWGLIGVVPLLTGLMRWCPAYSLFGVKTCPSAR